ncbi:MAG TPA: SDR family oxidoreductase [Bacteroidota bacterium]|nr:SDR family oxidoreductase [Bacteroidota bacterium]
MELKNKTALITGGGSGIGFAIAQALAREGMNLVLASRRLEFVAAKAEELRASKRIRALGIGIDVRSKKSVQSGVAAAINEFGAIDVLVNNSGVGTSALAVDLSEDEWDRVLDTNLKGAFFVTQAVLPYMIKQKSGHIINIASQAGRRGYPNASAYCASKFGLIGFGQSVQEEVREYGIKVTNVLPALVQVPSPAKEAQVRDDVLQVEDLAQTVLFVLRQPDRVKVDDIGLWRF